MATDRPVHLIGRASGGAAPPTPLPAPPGALQGSPGPGVRASRSPREPAGDAAFDPTTRCLRRAIASHFDPDGGTPFWLDRARELGMGDVRREVRDVGDLGRLGALDRQALLERPLADFVPRRLRDRLPELVLSETGGTTGRPVRAVFTRDELEAAFGAPFLAVSAARGFPRGGSWLFVGPSGPHVIGRAARLLARLHGAAEPFSVDLDPRFARAQAPGSLGERLYREHVVAQARDILAREPVDVLFTTPPLAVALSRALSPTLRGRLSGIHLGGMTVAPAAYRAIRETFPRAVILPAYGNSLFGILVEPVAPDLAPAGTDGGAGVDLDYFPLPGRLVVTVVDDAGREVAPGRRGRVCLTRLDESFLIVGHVERDVATRIAAGPVALALGLAPLGIRNPAPAAPEQAGRGLY